ncbi:hypothetical protein [Paraferrimonas sp. SM1919]|uniref:hypothetical protein n=1 Tax=Paraferrimonas sp. SM1919 TaxID=2662263 RepID=UPI0013D79242|nr:hypothetical protein [Paraferrimonas sp. SM1919]
MLLDNACIYLQNITVIDHAYMTDTGLLQGESFNFSCEIYGQIDQQEHVIIDFSGCKKAIKTLIDDSEFAIDHRLILIKDWSDYQRDNHHIKNANIDMLLTADSYTEINWLQNYPNSVKHYLETMLLQQLKAQGYPITNIVVELDTDFTIPKAAKSHINFHYVHGLKHSSSYGCQNIAHGHRSYIACDAQGPKIAQLLQQMAASFSGILAWDDNLAGRNTIGYTCPRGKFRLDSEKFVTLEDETTIENLAYHIVSAYAAQLKKLNVSRIWVSEGLAKGALVTLN